MVSMMKAVTHSEIAVEFADDVVLVVGGEEVCQSKADARLHLELGLGAVAHTGRHLQLLRWLRATILGSYCVDESDQLLCLKQNQRADTRQTDWNKKE